MKRRFRIVGTAIALWVVASLCWAAQEAKEPPYKPDANYKPSRDLSQFFAKIKAGRPVTIMGIGGSVTEGHSWAAMSAEWLQKQYPNQQIRYVDAALGGRGPDLAVFRFRRDMLPQHPDLVLIEYLVNSYSEKEQNYKSLDGMVLQLLRQDQKPAIVFVYVGDKGGPSGLAKDPATGRPYPWSWFAAPDALVKVQPLARHYGFQEVDVRSYLQGLIDDGKIKWEEFARDAIHPVKRGHAIYAEPVIELFKQQAVLADRPAPERPVPAPYSSDEWATAAQLPIAAIHFGNEWKVVTPLPPLVPFMDELIETDRPGATVTVTANTTTFGMCRIMTDDGGRLAWAIDGGKETEFNLRTRDPKGRVWFDERIFQSNLAPGEHTLRLRVLPKEEKTLGNMVRIGSIFVTNPKPVRQ